MQVNEFSKAVVGGGCHLDHLCRLGVLNTITLHEHSKLNKPIAEQACDYLQYGNASGDYQTKLGIFLNTKIADPGGEPDCIGGKEWSYINVQ